MIVLRHPIGLGVVFFILQLLAILGICPEKNWLDAWLSLASHWDSEWYESIANYGYINIDGPVHCGLRNANVVFFPGYPYLARVLVTGLHWNAKTALLLVAQSAALGFWCCLFYILRHIPRGQQLYTALLIMLFPTSWFMFMAYSESLFIVACCVTLYWASEERWAVAVLGGVLMTATRLIGLPVVMVPFFSAIIVHLSKMSMSMRENLRDILQSKVILALGSLGCGGFFMYCAHNFGSWHLYFDMERLHWAGTADPGFLFQLPTWVPPPWGYDLDFAPILPNEWSKVLSFDFFRTASYSFSEILVPVFLWMELFFAYWFCKTSRSVDEKSLLWFLASVFIYLFTCFSLATRHYESMSRCLLPVWIFLVIGDALNPNGSFFFRAVRTRALRYLVGGMLLVCVGFWIELLNRFFLGWWVA